jgi:hypothetical protein
MFWIFIKSKFLPFLVRKNLCLYLDRNLAKKLDPDLINPDPLNCYYQNFVTVGPHKKKHRKIHQCF